jgi:hypothetical protein
MKTRILIAAFASLSVLAAAQTQSNEKKDTPKAGTEAKSPRDMSTGQASGRAAGHLEAQGIVHRDLAAREASTGQASGKAAAADMNSDGQADRTGSAGYNVKSQTAAREAASGQASGKAAAADMNSDGKADKTAGSGYNVKNQTKARVAAGDVNGDGTADATAANNSGSTKDAAAAGQAGVKSPRDAASGMPTGKRQHEPVTIQK